MCENERLTYKVSTLNKVVELSLLTCTILKIHVENRRTLFTRRELNLIRFI